MMYGIKGLAAVVAGLSLLVCSPANAQFDRTIEAENMPTKTAGGSYNGIHNIWSNGYIEQTLNLPAAGKFRVDVTASGTPAGGVYPNMELRIDGRKVDSVTVDAYRTHSFSADIGSGSHRIAVAFTNDAYINGEDRNLLVDKVRIQMTSQPVVRFDKTVEAEDMPTKTAGGSYDGLHNIWSNGYVEAPFDIPGRTEFQIDVRAQGTAASGVNPQMVVRVDGKQVGSVSVGTGAMKLYSFATTLEQGTRHIAVAFTNDAYINGEDRNLLVDKVRVFVKANSSNPQPNPEPSDPQEGNEPVNGVRYPFGSRPLAYNSNVIFPQVSKSSMDASVKRAYDTWKAKYIKQGCGAGRYYVAGGQTGYLAVSEGQGYGMLLAVLMAGHDPQARQIFDGIFRFARDHGGAYGPYMMGWLVNNDCSLSSEYPAVDGDLDIAMALLMADKQWGSSTGSINYLQEAKNTIGTIKTRMVKKSTFTYIAGGPTVDITRTSDLMFTHFRAFKKATGDSVWDDLTNDGYRLLELSQNRHAPATGLTPDFLVQTNTSNPIPSPGNRLESDIEGYYAYNACRNPWRFASDYIVSGDARARNVTQKMINFFKSSSGGDPSRIYAVYTLDGRVLQQYNSLAFQAPIALGAMVDSSNQAFLNSMWNYVSQRDGGYYDGAIHVLSMVVMSGNWWQP